MLTIKNPEAEEEKLCVNKFKLSKGSSLYGSYDGVCVCVFALHEYITLEMRNPSIYSSIFLGYMSAAGFPSDKPTS